MLQHRIAIVLLASIVLWPTHAAGTEATRPGEIVSEGQPGSADGSHDRRELIEKRDVEYLAGDHNKAHTLDLDIIDQMPRTLVVFVHGGGWRHGDKAVAKAIASTFTSRGFNFAAVNYSESPQTQVDEEARDVAFALGYLVKNAASLGMTITNVAPVGFSAGGHLAALIATNPAFLRDAGLPSKVIGPVVLLDAAALGADWLKRPEPAAHQRLVEIFGPDEARWADMIPSLEAAKAPALPKFCIFYDGSRAWSEAGASSLQSALSTRRSPFTASRSFGRPHMSFVRDLTDEHSALSKAVISCLDASR